MTDAQSDAQNVNSAETATNVETVAVEQAENRVARSASSSNAQAQQVSESAQTTSRSASQSASQSVSASNASTASSASTPGTVPVEESRNRESRRNSIPRARRMKLSLTRIDPWSVTKVAFMLSIAGAIIQLVAVALLWFIMDAIGAFDTITSLMSSAGLSSGSFNITSVLSLGKVMSVVTIVAVFEIIVTTILAAIVCFLYNISSSLVGGLHLTLGDD